MAKEATLQVRMDLDMKERVEALYRRMGTTFAEGVRMFAAQSLLIDGIPLTMSARPRTVSSYGILSEYANPALIAQEKNAFSQAMEEKYGKAD